MADLGLGTSGFCRVLRANEEFPQQETSRSSAVGLDLALCEGVRSKTTSRAISAGHRVDVSRATTSDDCATGGRLGDITRRVGPGAPEYGA